MPYPNWPRYGQSMVISRQAARLEHGAPARTCGAARPAPATHEQALLADWRNTLAREAS
jgi:hypothetical protein